MAHAVAYAGQYTDPATGLQYLRARYYDPATQQFLTVDPPARPNRAGVCLRRRQPDQWE